MPLVTSRERVGLRILGVVFAAAVLLVAAINVLGGPAGAPCRDSYSCRGFLVGGVDCVEDVGQTYCSRFCKLDGDCPTGWRCEGAHPTALGIPTNATGLICIKPASR
jgi:hypothetical protein